MNITTPEPTTRIPVLDPLRGIAALSVCFFHFTNGNQNFLPAGDPIASAGSLGWLGVEAFFVISGFIVPLSLYSRIYTIRDFGSFVLRRLKRLEPPYFACILLVLALHELAMRMPGFQGGPINPTWTMLLSHLAYLNAILDYGWLNPVFWTLAIEFQFYIFVGLLFPLLANKSLTIRRLFIPVVALLGFVGLGNKSLLPHWLPLFSIGILTCQYYIKQVDSRHFYLTLAFASSISFLVVGIAETIVGLFVSFSIIYFKEKKLPKYLSLLTFFGVISYSLYLIHVPIGGRVINISIRLTESEPLRYLAVLVALIISTLAAYVFWRLIELPSQLWSSRNHPTRVRPNTFS